MTWGFAVFLLTGLLARGDSLEDAARSLARKVAPQIAVSETVHVSERNLSSLPASEASRARRTFEQSLRRALRAPVAVEIAFSLSENAREFLLIAEVTKGDVRTIEMVAFRTTEPAPALAQPLPSRRLIWEQDVVLLDVREVGESIVVASANDVAVYEKREKTKAWMMPQLARDAQVRLDAQGEAITVSTPGTVCQATRSASELECSSAPGENNVWTDAGWPPHYSLATLSDGMTVVAEVDGRTHLYDAARKPIASWNGWAEVAAVCGTRVLASSDRERSQSDVVRAWSVSGGKPVAASAPLDLPGPVTALRAAAGGAVAIVHDLTSGKYVAYHVAVDCAQ